MNRKMIGSANGASAVGAGATRSTTASSGPEQGRDRQRQRLGHPEHDHQSEDGGQPVRRGVRRQRAARAPAGTASGADEQADRPAAPVELLLGRRVGLDGLDRLAGLRISGSICPPTRPRPSPSGTARRRATRPAACRPVTRRSTSRAAPPYVMAATAAAHAPVPDDSVGPTPRSQIRMRTRPARSTVRELDVGALREERVMLERRAEPRGARLVEGRARARRTADCRRGASTASTGSPPTSMERQR